MADLLAISFVIIAGAIAGCVYSWRTLMEYGRQLEVTLEAMRRGDATRVEQIIAESHVRKERNRLITQACFLAAGVITTAGVFVEVGVILRWALRLVLLVGIVLVFLNSYLEDRANREARDAVLDEGGNG